MTDLRQAAGQVAKEFGEYADLEPVDTAELMDRLVIFAQAQRRAVWEEAARICDENERYYKSMAGQGDHFDIAARRCAKDIRAKAKEKA